ncbi:MAG: choice-of-anchor D domain-containing protein, partial [Myxococcota bacterium]|nr:choice-of-anchor D domain-containing protein [Myxococcota bacterium]
MFLLLLSCSEHGLQNKQGTSSGASPRLSVSPQAIDFGVYTDEPVVQELDIRNDGDGILHVQPFMVQGEEANSFTVLPSPNTIELQKDEQQSFSLSFVPMASENNAWIDISSNDTQTGNIRVSLTGRALLPALQVVPNPLDMGDVPVECTAEQTLILSNTGEAPLSLYSISDGGGQAAFSYSLESTLPTELQPSEFLTLPVSFTPTALEEYAYELQVVSNAPS